MQRCCGKEKWSCRGWDKGWYMEPNIACTGSCNALRIVTYRWVTEWIHHPWDAPFTVLEPAEAAWKFIQCIDAHVTAERHMPDFQESRGCQEMGKKHEQGEITTRDHREARCYYCFGYPSSCMSSDSNYSSTSASISDNGRYCWYSGTYRQCLSTAPACTRQLDPIPTRLCIGHL